MQLSHQTLRQRHQLGWKIGIEWISSQVFVPAWSTYRCSRRLGKFVF